MECAKIVLVVVLAVITVQRGVSEVITVSPSCDASLSSCVTLSQFSPSNSTNITLVLLPGDHSLNTTVRIQERNFFALQGHNGPTNVYCSHLSLYTVSFEFLQVNEVAISGIVFINCYMNMNVRGSLNDSSVNISQSEFIGSHTVAVLLISNCHSVSISHASFRNYIARQYGTILRFDHINNLEITHSNFENITGGIDLFHCHNVSIRFFILRNYTFGRRGYTLYSDGTNNFEIIHSNFENINVISNYAYYYVLYLVNCQNLSITYSIFRNINAEYGLYFYQVSSLEIVHSNFENIQSRSIITSVRSRIIISCCNFQRNMISRNILEVDSHSTVIIANSTFKQNTVSGYGTGLVNCGGTSSSCSIISSVFRYNDISDGFLLQSVSVLLASEFSQNALGQNGYFFQGNGVIDCTYFFNNTQLNNSQLSTALSRNSSVCNEFLVLGDGAICNECEVCRPPSVVVELENTEYRVKETIGNEKFALQLCAVSTYVSFPISITIDTRNGSAIENEDFVTSHECEIVRFSSHGRNQKHCIYVRILQDSENEGDEQFSVQLLSDNPLVILRNNEAIITIEDATSSHALTTSADVSPNTAPGTSNSSLIIVAVVGIILSFLTWVCGLVCGSVLIHQRMKKKLPSQSQSIQESSNHVDTEDAIYDEVDMRYVTKKSDVCLKSNPAYGDIKY